MGGDRMQCPKLPRQAVAGFGAPKPSVRSETPQKIELMPWSMPSTQAEFDGQRLNTITPRTTAL